MVASKSAGASALKLVGRIACTRTPIKLVDRLHQDPADNPDPRRLFLLYDVPRTLTD